jgi:hypothetical protein
MRLCLLFSFRVVPSFDFDFHLIRIWILILILIWNFLDSLICVSISGGKILALLTLGQCGCNGYLYFTVADPAQYTFWLLVNFGLIFIICLLIIYMLVSPVWLRESIYRNPELFNASLLQY